MKQRARIIRDLPEMKLVGRQMGPFASGQEAEFEAWEAAVLERHGFVEPTQKLTTTEIRKLILSEERAPGLGPLPSSFYATVAHRIAHLLTSDQFDEMGEFQAAVRTLTEIRIQKLVRTALSPTDLRNLLPEEQSLVNRLAMALEDWRRWLSELLEKEAEKEEVEKDMSWGR